MVLIGFLPGKCVEIEGLGIDSQTALWMGQSAKSTLQVEAARMGMMGQSSSDEIRCSDGAWVSGEALRAFQKASEQESGPVVGVLSGPMARWANEPCFGPPARLYRNVPLGEEHASLKEIEFELPCRTMTIPSADAPGGRVLEIPVSDALLISTHHWSGVLWANLLSLAPTLWRKLVGANGHLLWKLPWAWLKRRTSDPYVLAGAFNRKGKGVFVHPSAVVEGCWLQDGVNIGPGAVVRGSVLGPGARVEAQALVAFSVLGREAVVQRRGWVQFSVVHDGAAVGGAMQLGVLGPNVAFKHGAYLMDQNLNQSVSILRKGCRYSAPLGLLGVGVGARSTIASGVWVAPGRTIESDQNILPGKSQVLIHPVQGEMGSFRLDDGGLKKQ